jgi:hypothetical protein
MRKKKETNDNTHTIKNAHFFICLYLLINYGLFVLLSNSKKLLSIMRSLRGVDRWYVINFLDAWFENLNSMSSPRTWDSMKFLKGLDSCICRNNYLPSFRRNSKFSPCEEFIVYSMREEKVIVNGNFVKIKAFWRKYYEAYQTVLE